MSSRILLRMFPFIRRHPNDSPNRLASIAISFFRSVLVARVCALEPNYLALEAEMEASLERQNLEDPFDKFNFRTVSSIDLIENVKVANSFFWANFLSDDGDDEHYAQAAEIDLWQSVRDDAIFLSQGTSSSGLMNKPLWNENPDWWREEMRRFRQSFSVGDLLRFSWGAWFSWYTYLASGEIVFGLNNQKAATALEFAIAQGGRDGKFHKEFWDREPGEINREIAGWVAEALAAEAFGDVPATDQPSEDDFQSRPASVETTGKNGDVDLVRSKPATELPNAVLHSVTASLADGLRNLADAAEAQADKRFTAFMRKVAATIELAPDNQELLFESGRNYQALDYYTETVEEQWGVLAGQYHGLLMQFEKTLQKFEAWRVFMAEPLQPFDSAAAKSFNEDAQQAQNAFEKAEWLFKPRVVESLRFLGQRFNDAVLGTATEISNGLNIPSGKELLQSDLAVSLANVITSLAEAGIVRFGGKFLDGAGAAGDKAAWVAGFSAVLVVLAPVLKKFNKRYPVVFRRAKKAIAYMAKRLGIPDGEA